MVRLIANAARIEAALDVHAEHFADMVRAIDAFVRLQLSFINGTTSARW